MSVTCTRMTCHANTMRSNHRRSHVRITFPWEATLRATVCNVSYLSGEDTLWSTFLANCRKPAPPGTLRQTVQHVPYQDIEKQNGAAGVGYGRLPRQQSFRASVYFSIPPYITLKPNVPRRLPVRIRISRWRNFLPLHGRARVLRRLRRTTLKHVPPLISIRTPSIVVPVTIGVIEKNFRLN